MKKIIALVLTLALCLSLWIPAGAEEPKTPALPTDQEIMDYALYFMTESQEDPSIVIRDFAHLTDGAGNPTGYYVSFNNEAGPAGYVLLSLISGENPIVEGAFEGGGLFDTEEAASLFAETQLATLDGEDSPKAQIIFRGPEQIYLPVEGDTYYSIYDRETTTLETGIMPCNDATDYIYDWGAVSIKNSTVFKIKNFGSGTDYWRLQDFDFGNKNCSPTAATNVLWYWGFKRYCGSVQHNGIVLNETYYEDKAQAIHDILCKGMGTNLSVGTDPDNVLNGFEAFFGSRDTKIWNHADYYQNKETGYYILNTDFMQAFNDQCPMYLGVSLRDEVNQTKWKGHATMGFGYAYSTSNEFYVFVMDGYANYGRFVRPKSYPRMYGYKIWVAS